MALSSATGNSAMAQTGPKSPRLLHGSLPDDSPVFTYGEDRRMLLKLSVNADGGVSDARRVETSGDPAFDRLATEYFAKFRLVPALDAQGVPVADDVELRIDTSHIYEPGPGQGLYRKERQRIERMHCKDFLWEYEFMREILGNGSMARERLMRTSLKMFTDHNRVKSAALTRLEANLDITVLASAVQCYQKPEELYWQGVFVPTVHAQMRRLGLAQP
jgi:TonB family protein